MQRGPQYLSSSANGCLCDFSPELANALALFLMYTALIASAFMLERCLRFRPGPGRCAPDTASLCCAVLCCAVHRTSFCYTVCEIQSVLLASQLYGRLLARPPLRGKAGQENNLTSKLTLHDGSRGFTDKEGGSKSSGHPRTLA